MGKKEMLKKVGITGWRPFLNSEGTLYCGFIQFEEYIVVIHGDGEIEIEEIE